MSISFLARPLIYAVPVLAVNFGIFDLACYSTSDGLSFLACILAAYLYLKRYFISLLIFLPIMVCIKIDLLLFTTPLLFFVFVFEKSYRLKTVLSTVVSIAIYIGIMVYWENPGWSSLFYFNFIKHLDHPISLPPTLTIQDYLYVLLHGIINAVYDKSFILYLLLTSCSIYFIKNHANKTSTITALKSPSAVLTVVCLVFIVSHFVIFPAMEERYLSGPYLISAFSLLVMMTSYMAASNSAQQVFFDSCMLL